MYQFGYVVIVRNDFVSRFHFVLKKTARFGRYVRFVISIVFYSDRTILRFRMLYLKSFVCTLLLYMCEAGAKTLIQKHIVLVRHIY